MHNDESDTDVLSKGLGKIEYSVTRRLQFCAGHRVYGHETKCKHPHGHNYTVYVTAKKEDDGLDTIGRVIDFSVLKEKLGTWLDDNWDHAFIYWSDDEDMAALYTYHQDWKHYVMPANPTAENMAGYLLRWVCPTLFLHTGVKITAVTVVETDNCSAGAE